MRYNAQNRNRQSSFRRVKCSWTGSCHETKPGEPARCLRRIPLLRTASAGKKKEAVFLNSRTNPDCRLYETPLGRAYWREAAGEVRKTRMLVFAALMIALRVATKPLNIPVGANLRLSVNFFVNAYGAMVMGPVLSLMAAAVSDFLGWLLVPSGPYFVPFILTEMASSLLFALCLYRARITVRRVVLSRFLVDFLVNIVLSTPITLLYYRMMLGKSYMIFNLPRFVKNIALFPLESVLLVFFLRFAIPPTRKKGFNVPPTDGLRFTKRDILQVAALMLLGAASVILFLVKK